MSSSLAEPEAPRRPQPVITCEHGGNRLPARYRTLFRSAGEALASHRGHDPGSLQLGRDLARGLEAPLVAATVTRLLVDLNRSPGNPTLFSGFTRGLGPAERQRLLESHYYPHRRRVEALVDRLVAAGPPVVHFSVHTFTPVYHGRARSTDVGLLFDPQRPRERALCERLRGALGSVRPELVIHFNRPYRGWTDGLTTALRRRYPADRYLGIELEVSQRFPAGDRRTWESLRSALVAAATAALDRPRPI